MTKSLRKGVILRSRLKNNFNKKKSDEIWDNYKKQRNFYVKLLRQTKEKYFNDIKSISVKSISGIEKFWKTIKSFLTKKGLNKNDIMLVENNEIVRQEEINNSKHYE